MSPTSYQLLYPASSSAPASASPQCQASYNFISHIILYSVDPLNMSPSKHTPRVGAGDRGRTGTIGKDRRILSPVRLPIPPFRRTNIRKKLAPRVGLEPTAYRLTAGCSTIELPRNTCCITINIINRNVINYTLNI